MTVYVIREGKLVEKSTVARRQFANSANLSMPMISRLEPFESPVTGKEITSWGERERDMAAVGAVDPRDLPQKPFEKRRADNARARNTQA